MNSRRFVFLVVIVTIVTLLLSGCFLFQKRKIVLKPILIFPQNNSTNISTTVKLIWNERGTVKDFSVLFGTSQHPTFQKSVSSTITIENNLKYSTTYYWQIVAVDNSGETASSEIWHFTTVAIPKPSTPVLRVASASTSTISLKWSKSKNASFMTIFSST